MRDPTTKGFEQAYNAQAVVDETAQIIVATGLTQEANDKQQLVPMLQKVQQNLGEKPRRASADAGYFSAQAVSDPTLQGIDMYVYPDKVRHTDPCPTGIVEDGPAAPTVDSLAGRMRHKIQSPGGWEIYKKRKAIVEPVFGQTKEVRGFRRFLLRGHSRVACEWDLICTTHNLLKLYRASWKPAAH